MDELITAATFAAGVVGGIAGAAYRLARLESRIEAMEKALADVQETLHEITVITVRDGDG